MLIEAAESKNTACSRHAPRAPNRARCLQQPVRWRHALLPVRNVRNSAPPGHHSPLDFSLPHKRLAPTDAAGKRHPRGGSRYNLSQADVCSAQDSARLSQAPIRFHSPPSRIKPPHFVDYFCFRKLLLAEWHSLVRVGILENG